MKGFTKAIHKTNIHVCRYNYSSDEESEEEEMRKKSAELQGVEKGEDVATVDCQPGRR